MSMKTEKHRKEALEAGLILLGDGDNQGTKIYQWIECGHVGERHTSAVRKKSIVCKECVSELQAKQALRIGLRLMGKSTKEGYKKYRWASCRHICDYKPTAVRMGKVTCQKCVKWSF